jgi:DNA helicase HerA-like ATPase
VNSEPIGSIVNVSGHTVEGVVLVPSGLNPTSDMDRVPRMGSLVRIETPGSIVYGTISSLDLRANTGSSEYGWEAAAKIDLLGELILGKTPDDVKFQRGVSVYPVLGSPIALAGKDEIGKIYARPNKPSVRVGMLYQNTAVPAFVKVNDMLGKHFSILGTTGSGKSSTVVLILSALLDNLPRAHVVLIDPHDEYSKAFGDIAEVIAQDTLKLPYWFMNHEELCELLTSKNTMTSDAERLILKDAITEARRQYMGENPRFIPNVDTPVPFRIQQCFKMIEEAMGRLEKPEGAQPYLRLLTRIDSLRNDTRYSFMFPGISISDNMVSVLQRILRRPVDGKPITILNMAGVPAEVADVVISFVCRTIFAAGVWAEDPRIAPLLLVCEEAHRYVPRDESLGFAPTRKALGAIAKEGRKYGISLGLITQRPSEISESILSQCGTLFALRMSNDKDQTFIKHAMPEGADGFIKILPTLRTQECVVVGEGVEMPMRIKLDDLSPDRRPRSDTADFAHAWKVGEDNPQALAQTVENWRRQSKW